LRRAGRKPQKKLKNGTSDFPYNGFDCKVKRQKGKGKEKAKYDTRLQGKRSQISKVTTRGRFEYAVTMKQDRGRSAAGKSIGETGPGEMGVTLVGIPASEVGGLPHPFRSDFLTF
jgi:hypothetical protein